MQSPHPKQPSPASSSSPSSTIASLPTSSLPHSPAGVKSEPSCGKCGTRKKMAVAILFSGVGLVSALFILVWPGDRSPFRASSSTRPSSANVPPAANRHRGIVIGADVEAADLAAAYRSIKSEYAALALLDDPAAAPSSSDARRWRPLSSHADGSEVSLLEHPTDPSCPYVRMTSVMPGTVREVWDFLDLENWETSMPKMDPFYEGLTVLGGYEHGAVEMRLARKTMRRFAAFGRRDFAFVSVSDRGPANGDALVSGTVSVETDRVPREDGYVRAYQDSIGFYEPAGDDEETGRPRTRLTIVFRLDLNDSGSGGSGGFVPMWIYVKTVGTTGMASVQSMKRQLELMAEERNSNDMGGESCDSGWFARIRNGKSECG